MSEVNSTLVFEVVKPLDITWDDLSLKLHALRAPLHRILNNTLKDIELSQHLCGCGSGKKIHECHIPEHWAVDSDDNSIKHPRSLAYQRISYYWAQERLSATGAKNPTSLTKAIGSTPPTSALLVGTANMGHSSWSKFNSKPKGGGMAPRFSGEMSLPSYAKNAPLRLEKNGYEFFREGKLFMVALNLWGEKGHPYKLKLILRPEGDRYWKDANFISENQDSIGDLRLVKHDEKWLVKISWTKEVVKYNAPRIMAIHPGITNFISYAISRDSGADYGNVDSGTLVSGHDIIEYKKRMSIRRAEYGKHLREQGDGAKGHGRTRRYETIDKLSEKEENWVDTKIKQVAANIVNKAVQSGVSRVVLPSWSTPAKDSPDSYFDVLIKQFPFAKLQELIIRGLSRAGIEHTVSQVLYESRICPKCKHKHDSPPVLRGNSGKMNLFQCKECSLQRYVDVIAPWNMLIAEGVPNIVEEDIKDRKQKKELANKLLNIT